MSQRKLYLVGFGAIKWVAQTVHGEHHSTIIVSHSQDEAINLTKETVFKDYPESEGWREHRYDVAELTEHDIAVILDVINNPYDAEDAPTKFLM